MSCDWHDNKLFWHGNTSTIISHMHAVYGYSAVSHDIPHKPHGVNLIGVTEFIYRIQKSLNVYQALGVTLIMCLLCWYHIPPSFLT